MKISNRQALQPQARSASEGGSRSRFLAREERRAAPRGRNCERHLCGKPASCRRCCCRCAREEADGAAGPGHGHARRSATTERRGSGTRPEAMDDARRRSIRRTSVLMSLRRRCRPSTQAPGRRYPDESPGKQARDDCGGALGHQQQADGPCPVIARNPGRKDEEEDDGPPDGGRVAARA